MGNTKILMVLAIAAVGLFAMPQMLATYAGTHSVQGDADNINVSGTKGSALNCLECHQYISDETQVLNATKATYNMHAQAATNKNYTTYMAYYGDDYNTTPANLSYPGIDATFSGPWFTARRNNTGATVHPGEIVAWKSTNGNWYSVINASGGVIATPQSATDDLSQAYDTSSDWRGCLLCHRSAFFYGGSHTRITVKGCTNLYCHGNGSGQTYNQGSRLTDLPEYYAPTGAAGSHSKVGYVGNALNNSADAHNNWFKKSKGQETNAYYNYDSDPNSPTKVNDDYFTCLGCHSHANMKLDITRPNTFNLTMSKIDTTFAYTQNNTNATINAAYKTGSAWDSYRTP